MAQPAFDFDPRPDADPNHAWWKGATGEAGIFWYGYESLWLPDSLLKPDAQQRLADALFAGSRHAEIGLHFNKGLAGAPPEAQRATSSAPTVYSASTCDPSTTTGPSPAPGPDCRATTCWSRRSAG